MTSAIPGHDHAVPGADPRSALIARISRSALTTNARTARDSGIRSFDPSLLDADAWGHGAQLVRGVLEAEGFAPGGGSGVAAGGSTSAMLSALALFGLPGAERPSVPALRLTGTVLSVKDLRAGEGVSYGYAFRATTDTRVALVTGGYAQGILRGLGNSIDVAVAQVRHRVVGRVAMDVCVVEITDAVVRRGDEVLFLGDPADGEPSLVEWEAVTGLTAAELVTMIGLRATREESP